MGFFKNTAKAVLTTVVGPTVYGGVNNFMNKTGWVPAPAKKYVAIGTAVAAAVSTAVVCFSGDSKPEVPATEPEKKDEK